MPGLEPILLGLSTGTYCIMICAPVALPFFFSHELTPMRNTLVAALFLVGRLAGYILAGAIIGAAGGYAVSFLDPQLTSRLASVSFIFLGALMAAEGVLLKFPHLGFCRSISPVHRPEIQSILYGLLTALNLCPPFFAAASRVFAGGGGTVSGALYFILFFLGTTVYFIPLFGIPLYARFRRSVQPVARLTMILLGLYFFLFVGLLSFVSGGAS